MAEPGGNGRYNYNKQPPTSLFLNPPASGFPYGTNFGQSPLLVPVSSHADVTKQNMNTEDVSNKSSISINDSGTTVNPQQNISTQPNMSQPSFTGSTTSFSNLTQNSSQNSTSSEYFSMDPQNSNPQSPDSASSYFTSSQPADLSNNPQKNMSGRFAQMVYTPVHAHWMYCKEVEKKPVWVPFSLLDSVHLEEEYIAKSGSEDFENVVVQTDGGRYDVRLKAQERHAVYWEENNTPVRRATWFYRPYGARQFIPYPEMFADKLEEEYCVAVTTNSWHRRLEFPEGDIIVMHNPNVIVYYQASSAHEWEGVPDDQVKPTVVKRGMDDFENISDGEGLQIDHLVFVVHGIGAVCDLRFRTLPEVVDDFRTISADLLKSHYNQHVVNGQVGRIEFLPASWHTFLHGEATGIDDKLKPITLTSIPKLRYFANDAILDVLFYTSPVYCQAIINQVCFEINRLYKLFLSRNPTFHGKVSLAGHSLGSVILFDLLYHQENSPEPPIGKSVVEQLEDHYENQTLNLKTDLESSKSLDHVMTLSETLDHLDLSDHLEVFEKEKMDLDTLAMCSEEELTNLGIPLGPRKKLLSYLKLQQEKLNKELSDKFTNIPKIDSNTSNLIQSRRQSETTINYVVGLAGTGHPYIIYPKLDFHPTCFFAIGSPIAMFLTVRGFDMQWDDFKLPTCPAFYNIFHPYDPVAYRIEPLLKPENYNFKPVMISHHKGRKRMHLELKESLSRVSADLKQKFFDSIKTTWNTINDFARSHSGGQVPPSQEDNTHGLEEDISHNNDMDDAQSTISESASTREEDILTGKLNGGRRIDYVLQEKPIESFNEYLFALGSHTCYWESEDTVLLMLKEVYGSYGIFPSAIPSELPLTNKPTLYNPIEAQRYYAANPHPGLKPDNNSFNPYRLSSQQSTQPIIQATPQLQTQIPTYSPINYNNEPVQNSGAYSSYPSPPGVSHPPPPPMGMDPTSPPSMTSVGGPPPMSGFVKQSAIRK